MKQIKEMLQQLTSQKGGADNKSLTKLLDDLDDRENGLLFSANQSHDDVDLKSFVAREKLELRDLLNRLEEDKRRYRVDKKEADELKYTDPSAYRQRTEILEVVKDSIERQIDKVNNRISKLKETQKQLKK
jgi:hypothetical protein